MKRLVVPLAIVALGSLPFGAARAACYTVYQGTAMVFRSVQVPVDLSKTLHETVPPRFGPGASMVIAADADGCRPIDDRPRRSGPSSAERAAGAGPMPSARTRASTAERYFDSNATPIRTEVGGTP